MVTQNRAALRLMEEGYFPDPDAIDEWVEMDSDESFNEVLGDAFNDHIPLNAVEADPDQLRADLENDVEILKRWRDGARKVEHGDDEKLHALRDTLHNVVANARNDAESGEVSNEILRRPFVETERYCCSRTTKTLSIGSTNI